MAAGVFLVSAVAALAVSTAVVLAEQKETEKQRLVAVKNYEMSRKQAFEIIKLIEATEPEMATQPALHDRRGELLTTTSAACRQFREQDPDDLELRKRTALILRFTANFHRYTNETREAELLYKDSISLQEKLASEFVDEPDYRLQLAATLKDYANLQFAQCRFAEAAQNFAKSLEIADELLKIEPNRSAYLRMRASALHHQAALEYVKGKPKLALVLEVVGLYKELLEGAREGKHAYDSLMLATALNSKALIERDVSQLKQAGATHQKANEIIDEQIRLKPKMVSFPDLLHFRAHCRVEQARSWAKDPKLTTLAEQTVGGAVQQWEQLVRDYPKIPMYQEALAIAYQIRGEIREQLKRYKDAKDDFNKSQTSLAKFAEKYRDLPGLQGELGKSYAGMGRVIRQLEEKGAEEWFSKARVELRQVAEERAPEHADLRRALDKLDAISPR